MSTSLGQTLNDKVSLIKSNLDTRFSEINAKLTKKGIKTPRGNTLSNKILDINDIKDTSIQKAVGTGNLDKWMLPKGYAYGNLGGITYGNNLFVAVGVSGTILTSPDGITWTSRTSGTNNWLDGITYGNGLFVAVGLNGTILINGKLYEDYEPHNDIPMVVQGSYTTTATATYVTGLGFCPDKVFINFRGTSADYCRFGDYILTRNNNLHQNGSTVANLALNSSTTTNVTYSQEGVDSLASSTSVTMGITEDGFAILLPSSSMVGLTFDYTAIGRNVGSHKSTL